MENHEQNNQTENTEEDSDGHHIDVDVHHQNPNKDWDQRFTKGCTN